MNILVVCHYGLYEDLTFSFVHAQVKEYVRLGHYVRVVIPIALGKTLNRKKMLPLLQHQTADGVELYYVRFLSASNYGKKGFNFANAKCAIHAQLKKILSDFAPDIIHAHSIGTDGKIGAWLKERLGCPLVITTHGSDTSIPMEQGKGVEVRARCQPADHIVSVSSVLGSKLRACGTDTPITAILNGYAAQNRRTAAEKKNLSFLQVSHLQKQKRPEVTIRAFEKIRAAHPEASLTMIGQGPERSALQALCIELGIQDAVCFAGQIPNQEVLSEMARTQFFIMPSVREGLGIVYLEAMASGCITIGTEGEGISDLIISGKNGFLVPPDDPQAIVQIVEWCLSNPREASAIAQQGHQDAIGLTWEKNAQQYLQLFQTLIEEKLEK